MDPSILPNADRERLAVAVRLLEFPQWTVKVTDLIGMPIAWTLERLPASAGATISKATTRAIHQALKVAVSTMRSGTRGKPRTMLHAGAVMLSGAGGGFFGLPGAVIEVPFSTTVILRSIADIARSEGEDVTSIETQLNCIEVFALGGKSTRGDASESGYFAVRGALAKVVIEASEFIATRGLSEEGAPILARFISRIASRFEGVVSEKAAAEAVPIIGAAAGATINLLFINHFHAVARGHFTVRALERQYGEELIRQEYAAIAARMNVNG